MLDLTKQRNDYELKWFDGEIIHLPLPTQEMLLKVLKLEDVEDLEKQMDELIKIVKELLQNNREGRVFTEEDFSLLDLNIINLLMEDYMNSINQQLGE